jgi:ribosomal protein S6
MTTSRYELLYIIPTTFTDEEVGTVEQKIAALFTKVGATIDSTRRLGKFRLAYTIKTQRRSLRARYVHG